MENLSRRIRTLSGSRSRSRSRKDSMPGTLRLDPAGSHPPLPTILHPIGTSFIVPQLNEAEECLDPAQKFIATISVMIQYPKFCIWMNSPLTLVEELSSPEIGFERPPTATLDKVEVGIIKMTIYVRTTESARAFFRRVDETRPISIELRIGALERAGVEAKDKDDSTRPIQAKVDEHLPSNSPVPAWICTRIIHALSAENIPNVFFTDTTSFDPRILLPAVGKFIGSPAAKGVKHFVLPLSSAHAVHSRELAEGLDRIIEAELEKNTSIEVLCLHTGEKSGPLNYCVECCGEAAEWNTTTRSKPDMRSKQAVLERNRALRVGVAHEAREAFVEFCARDQRAKEMALKAMAFLNAVAPVVAQDTSASSGSHSIRLHPATSGPKAKNLPLTPSPTGTISNPSTSSLELTTVVLGPTTRSRPVTPFPSTAEASFSSIDLAPFPTPPSHLPGRATRIAPRVDLQSTAVNPPNFGSHQATSIPFPDIVDETELPTLEGGGTTSSGSDSDHAGPSTPADQLSTHNSTDDLFTEPSVDFSLPRHSTFEQADEIVPWTETPRGDSAFVWEDPLSSTPVRSVAGEGETWVAPGDTAPTPVRRHESAAHSSKVATPTGIERKLAEHTPQARPLFQSPRPRPRAVSVNNMPRRAIPGFGAPGVLATPRFSPRGANDLDLTGFCTQSAVAGDAANQVEDIASNPTDPPSGLVPDVDNEAGAAAGSVTSTPKPTLPYDDCIVTPDRRAAAEAMLAFRSGHVATSPLSERSQAQQASNLEPRAASISGAPENMDAEAEELVSDTTTTTCGDNDSDVVADTTMATYGDNDSEVVADTSTATYGANDSTFDSIPSSIEGALGDAMHSLRINNVAQAGTPRKPFPVAEDIPSVPNDVHQAQAQAATASLALSSCSTSLAPSDDGATDATPTVTEYRFLSKAQIQRIHDFANSRDADKFHFTCCSESPNTSTCLYSRDHAQAGRPGLGNHPLASQSIQSTQSTHNQLPPAHFNIDKWFNDNIAFERGVDHARVLWAEEQKLAMPAKNTLGKMVKKMTGSVRGKLPVWRKADRAL
ncbi:uncharacterized protein LOC62_07G009599 [Vanrija pseudolonga]|uniref:Uncharacterized protein n=1 Tax=Vanrija pseudolonga TaxID=143232 RepID=A0AAF0YG28_9TREE|nr:hypothetical protein LOC62_07G009599 [Vanrija pseudolonga]